SWTCSPVLAIGGKHHPLTMTDKSLEAPWRSMMGKPVRVTGSLEKGVIVVSTVERVFGSWVHKTVHIEVKGRLSCEWNSPAIWPPRPASPLWRIHAAGESYHLTFADAALAKKAEGLLGGAVLLKGTLVNGSIRVTSIESVG